jgi:enamine deaminase RidA (YjgF/YER057c/UK114 family)
MDRSRVPSNRPWDPVGYSRAIRVGSVIEVAGTTAASPDGSVIAPGDMYGQARACLQIIVSALAELGATPQDVVRTRVFLKDITRWEDAGRAHSEIFGVVKPASTFVQVTGFLDPEFLLEVEATAIVD